MHPHTSSSGRRVNIRVLAAVVSVAIAASFAALTFQPEGARAFKPAPPAVSPKAPSELVSLVDQENAAFSLQRFEGRTLVVTFIFTHCQTSCPLQVQALTGVQRALTRALSSRVQFVSFSIDPERDTPAVLKQYAAAMGARLENWSFVTGHPQEISWLHQHFGAQVKRLSGDQLDHRVAVYLLDANGELAQKYTGDLDPLRLAKEIADVDRLYNESQPERAQVR
jgi:protein SCO1/2